MREVEYPEKYGKQDEKRNSKRVQSIRTDQYA